MNCSNARKRVVWTLLALLLIGHGYDVATSQEHWPFSPYPMYSMSETSRTLKLVRMFGVKMNGGETPLNGTWMRNRLSIWEAGGPAARARIHRAARDFLLSYNRQRSSGERQGAPRLKAIRVYECTWYMASDEELVRQPDEKHLLTTVWQHKKTPPKHKHGKATTHAST